MTTQRIGYGRCSGIDQNTNDQEDALKAANCDRIFVEKMSGTKTNRPQWDEARKVLRKGDTLVFTRLDRLGRSNLDLQNIAKWCEVEGINLESTEQPIDTSTPEGKMFFSILAAFAEFEHDLIVARTRDGLAAARARGRVGGRKAKLTPQKVAEIRVKVNDEKQAIKDVADYYGVSRPTIYRALETE